MKSTEKDTRNVRAMSIRIPLDVLTEIRKIKASTEVAENRTVSLNEMIVTAMKEFVKTSNILL